LVAEEVGDDIGDAVRCTGLVHLGQHGVDRDVTLTEFECEGAGERLCDRYAGRSNAVGPEGGVRGRARERETLDRKLDRMRDGESAVLVLRGAAGIGKTALMHYCLPSLRMSSRADRWR
jgi:AAA ATPase domain